MELDKLSVLVGAGVIMGLIYWFFLGKRGETELETRDRVEIKVAGGYSPALVRVPAGVEVTITLVRTDPTECLEEFVIPDLMIKRSLEMDKEEVLKVKIAKRGKYEFHCGMNMYKGVIEAV